MPDVMHLILVCGIALLLVGSAILYALKRIHAASQRVDQIVAADRRERDGHGMSMFDETAVIPRIPAGHPLSQPALIWFSPTARAEIDALNDLYASPAKPKEPNR